MRIRELRIRYAVPEMFHTNDRSRDSIHAIICDIHTIKSRVIDIKKVGYQIVGYDERYRDDHEYMSPFDGWAELQPSKT